MASSRIGFVGIGIMGKGMVKNLVNKQPLPLLIWNRNKVAADEIALQYPGKVEVANTAKEVVERCNVTYCMLSNMEASISVFDSEDGVIAGVSPGKVIVDCATLTPQRMNDEAAAVGARGGKFLEAPVSGSKVPADLGQLIFLCGGEDTLFHELKDTLQLMGKASFLVGGVGKGTELKLVVNMIMGTMITAFGEGMALCKESQIDMNMLLQVLDLGAMSNPLFRGKGPNMIAGNYDPHFPLKHAQKDMRFALDLASSLKLSLPTTEAANQSFLDIIDKHGDDDLSAIFEASKRK